MTTYSLILRTALTASVLLLAACQSAPDHSESQYQKGEAAKLNAELSKELEEARQREKEAAQQ